MITKIMDGPTGSGVVSKVFPAHLDAWAKKNPRSPVRIVCASWRRTEIEYALQRIGSSIQPRYVSNSPDTWRGMSGDALLIFYQVNPYPSGDIEQTQACLQATRTPVWFVGCGLAWDCRLTPSLWVPGEPTLNDLDKMLEAANAD